MVEEKACSNYVGLVGEFREETHTSTAVRAELYSIYFVARITLIIWYRLCKLRDSKDKEIT